MRLLIISLFVSAVCFGQKNVNTGIVNGNVGDNGTILVKDGKQIGYKSLKDTTAFQDIKNSDMQSVPKVNSTSGKLSSADSLLIPVFSTKEVVDYLIRINRKLSALLQLEYISQANYESLTAELNKIAFEMDKKRKGIK